MWKDPPSGGLPRHSTLPSSLSPPTATPSTLPWSSVSAAGESESEADNGRDVAVKTARSRAAPCRPGGTGKTQDTARVSPAWREESRLSETAVAVANARSPGTERCSGNRGNTETRSVSTLENHGLDTRITPAPSDTSLR